VEQYQMATPAPPNIDRLNLLLKYLEI